MKLLLMKNTHFAMTLFLEHEKTSNTGAIVTTKQVYETIYLYGEQRIFPA